MRISYWSSDVCSSDPPFADDGFALGLLVDVKRRGVDVDHQLRPGPPRLRHRRRTPAVLAHGPANLYAGQFDHSTEARGAGKECVMTSRTRGWRYHKK